MKVLIPVCGLWFLIAGVGDAGVVYSVDDGSAEVVRGGFDGADGFIGNLFTAKTGGSVITAIAVAWGSPNNPGHAPVGTPIEVLLYDDPNNDGVLDDLVLLTSESGTITNPDSNTFVEYPITPTEVAGNFLAAALVRNLSAGPTPISTDQSMFQGATYTLLTPNIDTSNLEPNFSFPGVDGNAMVRATGVPEPSLLLHFAVASALGLAGLIRLSPRRGSRRG
ncbi:hypothetical protein [Aeoliella sp.]|uniref:hypothetical protein n=1 Tax=Aeoliella sp. TaxID=2795800 RepID=UPI003CCB99C8